MNFKKLFDTAPMTLLLIGGFIAVFIVQILQGVNIDNPSNKDLLNYGANFLPLTLTGDYWRLVSSGFLHIGIIHLLLNGFAMYYFGQVTEIIIGRWRFLTLFILSVVGGNLLNLSIGLYQMTNGQYPAISAGASGGIMGIGMALLVVSFSSLKTAKYLNRRSLFIIMAINIMMGFTIPNIDNAGHIGGAVSGAILGLSFVLFHRWRYCFTTTSLMITGMYVFIWHFLSMSLTQKLLVG